MNRILILNIFLLSVTHVLSFSKISQANTSNERVTNIMGNLVQHTESASKELLTHMLENAERISKALFENMDSVVANAMKELAQPLENYQQTILSSECQPLVTLEQLSQQIDADLSNCTNKLKLILTIFQHDIDELKVVFEQSIEQIIDIPKKCEAGDGNAGFGSIVNCYLENIILFNKEFANILKNATEILAQVRQLGEEALQEGRICVYDVIVATKDSLNQIVADCILNEKN